SKNFYHENDEQWRHQNVKLLFSKEAAMGSQIVEAVNEASGEVITILEDDDVWKESRLEKIFRLFAEIPQLYYYHNGIFFIDASGTPIDVSERRQVKILGSEQRKEAKRVNHQALHNETFISADSFNNSSIAVRKALIKNFKDHLVRMAGSLDKGQFYASLASGFQMFLDSEKLTGYRIHSGNRSGSSVGDFKEFINKHQKNAARYSTAFTILAEMCRTQHFEKLELDLLTAKQWADFNRTLFSNAKRMVMLSQIFSSIKMILLILNRTHKLDRWIATLLVINSLSLCNRRAVMRLIYSYYRAN
ncbi:MAG: glycosyltransferase, partial [Nitrososphaerota archaeon]|nr:glycosyltransferase [Nitrososphaerota archaeon]